MELCESTILPYVTFLISTYNRREVLARTLTELQQLHDQCDLLTETIVVDNASTDGTAEMLAEKFPQVLVIREETNRGACAKNVGLPHACGRYVIFLDDDSWPGQDSILKMVDEFQADPKLGAAIFDIILPDGTHECSAYPRVFIGCGTGFRREALDEVGGLPEDFFMQAEEYDLSMRLLEAGWDIRRVDGLQVFHQKTISSRIPARTTRLDARNNLTFVTRYFPRQWVMPFAIDWMRRYWWMARGKGMEHTIAFLRGLIEGIGRSLRRGHRQPVTLQVFEKFAMVREINQNMRRIVNAEQFNTILLVGVGKNILPYWMAAKACKVNIVAVADENLAVAGRKYRGVSIVDNRTASEMEFDAAIIANVSPVHAKLARDVWRRLTERPVIDLLETAAPETMPVKKVA